MNNSQDLRLQLLKEWLTAVLPYREFSLSVASSDASFRRYFRIQQGEQSWIAMDAPPEHEDVILFARIAEFLEQHQVQVPKVFARDNNNGFLLLADLGQTSYLSALLDKHHSADTLYKMAIDEIIKMQCIPQVEAEFPHYDATRLQQELALFPEWFLQRHLQLAPPADLDKLFGLLIDNALQQPQHFVHRDYHSRNLMLTADGNIGVIDFQDAVVGAISYDLVSLLKDCYIEWTAAQRQHWLNYYRDKALENNILTSVQADNFVRCFDLMGLQRHLKVLGIFCRLNYRDGKANYMHDLPLTLRYVLDVTERYPELASLHQFLTQTPAVMAIL